MQKFTLFTALFNLTLERVVREMRNNKEIEAIGRIRYWRMQIIPSFLENIKQI